jgi:hypothetical protein
LRTWQAQLVEDELFVRRPDLTIDDLPRLREIRERAFELETGRRTADEGDPDEDDLPLSAA